MFTINLIFAERRESIRFTTDEVLLLLRSYISYPADYSRIIEAMRENIATLPASTQEYYQSSTEKAFKATTARKKLAGLWKAVKAKKTRQKGGDLTQSYDKSPYTNRNVKGAKQQHKQRHKKVRLNSNCGPT